MFTLLKPLLLALTVANVRADYSRIVENYWGIDDTGDSQPNFELQSQDELTRSRQGTRGINVEFTTPCGQPPAIPNGEFTLISVYMSGDQSSKSYLLSYTCKASYRLVGRATLTCSGDQWRPVPACVHDDYDDTSRNTECSANPSPAEILACFPNIAVRFKYTRNSDTCDRYLACTNSNVGFTTAEDCSAKCIFGDQDSFDGTTAGPISNNWEMDGGRRGAQCLSGVPIGHTSCLGDSPYLLDTLENNVTEILAGHTFWRDRVNPPAVPPLRPLLWDDDLAITAERWAAQCNFAHDTASSRSITSRTWLWVGQSICASRSEQTWSACIEAWTKENRNWVYGVGPVPSTAVVGHYTQIVSANTTHIGCGRAQCSGTGWNYIQVCNYAPGGNVARGNNNLYAYPYNDASRRPAVNATTTMVPTSKVPTQTTPTVHESGGKRGPQCLPGVDHSSHSSCLDDSGNLVSTFRFNYDEILGAHNKVRRGVWPPAQTMPPLQWSEDLAIAAERWGAQCLISHNTGPDRKLPQWNWVGQNMRFTSIDKTWEDTITNWANESAYFRYGIGPVPSNATIGHYTQIIWGETTHVGCGKVLCRNIFWNYIYVCNYGPGGNVGVNGQSPFSFPYVVADGDWISTTAVPITTKSTPTTIRSTSPPTTTTRTTTRVTTTTKTPRLRTTTTTKRVPTTTTTTRIVPTTRVTTTTTTTPRRTTSRLTTTLSTSPAPTGRMSGGLRGPQCFPNVAKSHSSCLPDSPNVVRTYSFSIDEVLDRHNKYRRSVQPPAKAMPILQYSEELAIMAERWAAQCPTGHNSAATRATSTWDWVGQNICWQTGADESWTECIDDWASEQSNWRYGIGPVPSNSVVGHYTQMIWADTLYVGCGKAYCENAEWEYNLVCNYGPGGNIGNGFQSPYATPYQST